MNDKKFTLILRGDTGRTFSFTFCENTDRASILNSVSNLLDNIGAKATDDELAALDLQIQTLQEQRRLLTGKKGCGCGNKH